MDKFSLYAGQFVTFKEYLPSNGNKSCKGSGAALAFRQVYKAVGKETRDLAEAFWQPPRKSLISGTKPAAAESQTALLCIPKEKGGQENRLLISFDNESVKGKIDTENLIKRQPAIAAASGYAYVATASPSHPFDLMEKVQKGWESKGTAYIHILCPSPGGWGFDPENTVRLARMAVETRLFPLYEIVDNYYQITIDEPNPRPLKDYIKRQKRFAGWKAKKIIDFQNEVNSAFNAMKDKANRGL